MNRLLRKFATLQLQLAEEDELLWDDGTATPEPCLDKFELVTKVRPCGSALHTHPSTVTDRQWSVLHGHCN